MYLCRPGSRGYIVFLRGIFIYLPICPAPHASSIYLSISPPRALQFKGSHNYCSPIIECFDLGFFCSLSSATAITRSTPLPMKDRGMRYGNRKMGDGEYKIPPILTHTDTHTHTLSLPLLSGSTLSVIHEGRGKLIITEGDSCKSMPN